MHKPALKIFGLIILLTISIIGRAQKTDKVFLKNGDVVTGEIKSLKLAKLNFDMTGPGKISIKWEEVVRIVSNKTFQVTLQNGNVLLTKLDSLLFETHLAALDDIVEIIRIKNNFFKRLEGDVNLAFNYSKSSDIVQFNSYGSVTYRKPKLETSLKLNDVLSRSSGDSVTSKKQDVNLGAIVTMRQRNYLMGNVGWERNSQLGLLNRWLSYGGAGKKIINDNHQRLLSGVGLSYNKEEFNDSTGYKGSLEGLFIIEYKKFRYSTPKISIDAQYIIFPGLSDWGRVRMNFQVNTSIEVFKDFSIGLNFYDNFDNRPSSAAASTNDYGISFSIGYIFGK